MQRFIPAEKMGKKARKELAKARRRSWGPLNPVTRKPENPKAYNRKKTRREERFLDGGSYRSRRIFPASKAVRRCLSQLLRRKPGVLRKIPSGKIISSFSRDRRLAGVLTSSFRRPVLQNPAAICVGARGNPQTSTLVPWPPSQNRCRGYFASRYSAKR